MSTSALVDVNQLSATEAPALHAELDRIGVDRTQANYALKLESGKSITHNRFVVPDSGTLRFNLHVPNPSGGQLKVSIKGTDSTTEEWQDLTPIELTRAADPNTLINPLDPNSLARPNAVGYYDYNVVGYRDPYTNNLAYAEQGFETFHLEIPDNLRDKPALLQFKVEGGSEVYLDDVFFNSVHLKLGNPTFARPSKDTHRENFLIEKPQYSLSYNDATKGPNWVSWQLNKSWLGDVRRRRRTGDPPNTPYVEQIPRQYGSRFPVGFDDNFPSYPNGVNPVDGTFSPYGQNGNPRGYPWVADQSLPADWVKTQGADYQNNTNTRAFPNREFDRGHMTPFNDRTRTFKDALSTYLTTNLLPQQTQVNRVPWEDIEDDSNRFVKNNNAELYIIAGGAGYDINREDPAQPRTNDPFPNHPDPLPGVVRNLVLKQRDNRNWIYSRDSLGRISTRNGGNVGTNREWIINPKRIGIPDYTWKIIVPLQPGQGLTDITTETQIISVIMPNVDPRTLENNQFQLPNGTMVNLNNPNLWEDYAVTVDDVEALTGYNFLSELPEQIQDVIEQRRNQNFIL